MATYVTHPQIVGGRFDYASEPVVRKVRDHDAAARYFDDSMRLELAAVRRRELSDAREAHGLARLKQSQIQNPNEMFTEKLATLLPLNITFPWHMRFYEHINFDGDNFALGVVQNTSPIAIANPVLSHCDWDSDLTQRGGPCNGNWNDCVSSLRCIAYSKFWVICEHIHFEGDALYGSGDVPNLHDLGWGDKCSSIAMCSIAVDVIKAALVILIAAGV